MQKPPVRRPVERAYEEIRQAIIMGKLKPGDLLGEEQLAAMTGTSRTPVREALRRLVAEGLATANSRHRFVTDFSYDEVVIIFDIRARLEAYAAALAAERITQGELRDLQQIIEAIDAIAKDTTVSATEQFFALNTEFHGLIIEATRSQQLKLLSAPATTMPLALMKQFVWDQRVNITRSNEQHRLIFAALARRDGEAASAVMSSHILSTKPRPRGAAGVDTVALAAPDLARRTASGDLQ